MKTDEMIAILESIVHDEKTNPTARVTAIRALREIEDDLASRHDLDDELDRLLDRND